MKQKKWLWLVFILLIILIILGSCLLVYFANRNPEVETRMQVPYENISSSVLKNYEVEYRLSTITQEEAIFGTYEEDYRTLRIYGVTTDQDVVLTDQDNSYRVFVEMLQNASVFDKYVTTILCNDSQNQRLNYFIEKYFNTTLSGKYSCRFEIKNAQLVSVKCNDPEQQIYFYVSYVK